MTSLNIVGFAETKSEKQVLDTVVHTICYIRIQVILILLSHMYIFLLFSVLSSLSFRNFMRLALYCKIIFYVWSRYVALAIIPITFFCFKSTGNMLEGYVLPQTSAQ